MIYPSIFSVVSGDPGVQSTLGTAPVRFFPFGQAPDTVALPYAVWQVITGQPENYIGNEPDFDSFIIQVDIYGSTPATVRAAAEALRDAVEPHAHITTWRGESRDPDTHRFRFSFDVDFLASR